MIIFSRNQLRRLALLLIILLTACSGGTPDATPTATPESAAAAATDEAPLPPTETTAPSPTPPATPTAAAAVDATAEPEPAPTAAGSSTPPAEFLPPISLLRDGWHRLVPAGDTTCALGDPFSFFVRPADPQRLLIYFQGGGACWDGDTCDPQGSTADQTVTGGDSPERGAFGIFDLDNEENPFRDYSMVFVPYCTGDVHIGDSVATYAGADGELTVYHNGFNNSSAVLDWTFANFTAPEQIFVAGSSAGAIPTPFYTHFVAEQYPQARIAQLGDAAGAYRSAALGDLLDTWGTDDLLARFPAFELADEPITFDAIYAAAGRLHPEVQLAQYNTAFDSVQVFFLGLFGEQDVDLPKLIAANDDAIRKQIDNYDSFLAAGSVHTILQLPFFYGVQADGVRIRDWVADLAAGNPVDSVRCSDCTTIERSGGG